MPKAKASLVAVRQREEKAAQKMRAAAIIEISPVRMKVWRASGGAPQNRRMSAALSTKPIVKWHIRNHLVNIEKKSLTREVFMEQKCRRIVKSSRNGAAEEKKKKCGIERRVAAGKSAARFSARTRAR